MTAQGANAHIWRIEIWGTRFCGFSLDLGHPPIPVLVIGQNLAIYLWRGSPGWWLSTCKEILEI